VFALQNTKRRMIRRMKDGGRSTWLECHFMVQGQVLLIFKIFPGVSGKVRKRIRRT